jgi:putative nucleotidyltransferase with HDIG domain
MESTVEKIKQIVQNTHAKEYACHVQFVAKIGCELAEKYNADKLVVELACLLHDIGRHLEKEGEGHEQAGARVAQDILKDIAISTERKNLILKCIINHNAISGLESVEEQIVSTADGASKILHHEAFMLMCKKENHVDRLLWGQKYLEKGYKQILLPEVLTQVHKKYAEITMIYNMVAT